MITPRFNQQRYERGLSKECFFEGVDTKMDEILETQEILNMPEAAITIERLAREAERLKIENEQLKERIAELEKKLASAQVR